MNDVSASPEENLFELARAWNVQTSYLDVEGVERFARPDALLAVLKALGAPVASMDDAADALRARHLQRWQEQLPPVTVVWGDLAPRATLRLPRSAGPTHVRCVARLEDGGLRSWEVELGEGAHQAEVEGTAFEAHHLPLPEGLPMGYHTLEVVVGGRRLSSHLLVAPRRAWPGSDERDRAWGSFLPLYALRTGRNAPIADLSDLGALARWTGRAGGSVVGTLPLLAAFLDETPFEFSPYAPVSRLFWNELYLDLEALPEASSSKRVREILEAPGWRREAERLQKLDLVDYRATAAHKRRALMAAAEAFFEAAAEGTGAGTADLERFLSERPDAETYARFRATVEKRRESWWQWPDRLRNGDLREGDWDEAARRYHLYAQWAFDAQVRRTCEVARAAGTELYLDLPLGVHPDGYDVWRDRAAFAIDVSAGAPPDPFFTGGQSWGFPPMHPEGGRRTGHQYWAASIANHLKVAGRLRIDHVMGLHRLFWVPKGFDPTEGVYVRYPAEELWAVLAIESHRHRARVVGENLGTVPAEVDAALTEHGVQGMWVGGFAIQEDPEDALPAPPPGVLAAMNTHDMPTFAGWWFEVDIDQRLDLGFLDEAGAEAARAERIRQRDALCRFLQDRGLVEGDCSAVSAAAGSMERLADSEAGLVLLNLEDLWGEPEPQNIPGTHREVPNWKRRARLSLDRLRDDPGVREVLEAVARRRGS